MYWCVSDIENSSYPMVFFKKFIYLKFSYRLYVKIILVSNFSFFQIFDLVQNLQNTVMQGKR